MEDKCTQDAICYPRVLNCDFYKTSGKKIYKNCSAVFRSSNISDLTSSGKGADGPAFE